MDREELIAFLRDHLRIEVDVSPPSWDSSHPYIDVKLLIDDQEISSTSAAIYLT